PRSWCLRPPASSDWRSCAGVAGKGELDRSACEGRWQLPFHPARGPALAIPRAAPAEDGSHRRGEDLDLERAHHWVNSRGAGGWLLVRRYLAASPSTPTYLTFRHR